MSEIENKIQEFFRAYYAQIESAWIHLKEMLQKIKELWNDYNSLEAKSKPYSVYKKMVSQPYRKPVLRVARSRI